MEGLPWAHESPYYSLGFLILAGLGYRTYRGGKAIVRKAKKMRA